MLNIISSLLNDGFFLKKIFRLLFIIFFDLKAGPTNKNKKENNFLLVLIPKIFPIKKKRINYNGLKKIINYF